MSEMLASDTGVASSRSSSQTDSRPRDRIVPGPREVEPPSTSTTLSPESSQSATWEPRFRPGVSGHEIATLGLHAGRLRRSRQVVTPTTSVPRVRHRWMGVVESVAPGDYFEAHLTPLDDGPEVTATLSFDAVLDDDAPLIAAGASFYLHAGRLAIRPGTTVAFTSIKVRRLGKWRDEELEFLRERARKRQAGIDFQ